MRYQGHLPDGSGVQRHSAGDLYPFVLFAKQVGDKLYWGYIDPDDGREVLLVPSYRLTEASVRHLKAARERQRARFAAFAPAPAANDARTDRAQLELSLVG